MFVKFMHDKKEIVVETTEVIFDSVGNACFGSKDKKPHEPDNVIGVGRLVSITDQDIVAKEALQDKLAHAFNSGFEAGRQLPK